MSERRSRAVKLLWFDLLVFVALGLSLTRAVRLEVYRNPAAVLALCLGGCSLLALLKTQASHYVFPAAGFLLMFSVHVFARCLAHRVRFRPTPRVWATAGIAAALLIGGSAVLYQPGAM